MAAVMTVAPEFAVQGAGGPGGCSSQWVPEPGALKHVVGMLRESTSASSAVHGTLYRQLEAYATNSDFNNYLAHILVRGCAFPIPQDAAQSTASASQQQQVHHLVADPSQAASVRQVAGLLLKNNIRLLYKNLPQERQAFINGELLRAIGDDLRSVRASVAICIATIVDKTGVSSWPDLCPTLLRCLDSGVDAAMDGALTVLCRLAEDIPHLLDQDPSNPLDLVVPKVILFCNHPQSNLRSMALQIINHFLLVMPPILHTCIDAYCQALFRIAEDTSIAVRKRVCTAICLMLQSKPEALAPYMRNIIEYMLVSSKHENEQVALEACEFWSAYAEMKGAKDGLREYIPRVVPLLLDNMVYSDSDRALIGSTEEQDDMVPDRPEDIRPRFHQPRLRDASAQNEFSGRLQTQSAAAQSAPQASNSLFGHGAQSIANVTPSGSPGTNNAESNLQSHVLAAKSALAAPTIHTGFGTGAQSSTSHFPATGSSGMSTGSNLTSNNGRLSSSATLDAQVFQSSSSISGKGGMKGNEFEAGVASTNHINHREASVHNEVHNRNHLSSDEDEDDDDDVAWDSSEDGSEWNVRKCSASGLDLLATMFSDEVLAAVLPKLNEKLSSERWEQREVAVLALGAVANGCYGGMESHMASLFPFLIHLLSDPHYMVRSISCWTLSRYAKWVVHRRDDALFQQLLAAFLDRILDRNKTVQKAACSALASFEEEAGPALNAYLTPILKALVHAFGRYQAKNLIVLYDSICTLAEAVGTGLGEVEHLNTIMPPLISKWNSLADTDEGILPLLECLSCVFRAIGAPARQFAPNVLARCVNIVEAVYKVESTGEQQNIHVEFLTCSLDLMCGLTEAIGPDIDPLVANSSNGAKPLLPLVFLAMRDRRQEVRQSAFALVGEFARSRLPSMIPAFHEYVDYIIDALNPEYMSVSNNATWALGEVVMMAGFLPPNVPIHRDAIQRALVERALDPLIRVVNLPQLNKSLLENTAITLGRMGLVIPDTMAPRLGAFARATFSVLRDISDDAEKEQACHGMNALVKLNPTAIFDCFVYYVDAIASWYHCKADLEADYASILTGFKNSMGEQWFALFRSFPPALQGLLKERFKL